MHNLNKGDYIMKTGKKTFLLTLIMVLLSSIVLAACGSSSDTASGGAGAGKDGKPVELIWYTIGTPQKDVDKVIEKVNAYTKEKIGATIQMKLLDWGDYDQKMQVISASGEPFDIAFTSS